MIPDDLFTVLVFAFGLSLGLFLGWIVWRFHVLPNYFRRREGPQTYTPPIKTHNESGDFRSKAALERLHIQIHHNLRR